MRRLLFQKLLLLSLKEKKARSIVFHPKVTIIKGENDTGKSCLIKSIYRTFGAETPQVHTKWESANVISVLYFTIDGKEAIILRDGKLFCFFQEGSLVKRCTSVTKELSPFLSSLFKFKLPLKSKGKDSQATPAFLYLPFYFDQDQSWAGQWNSFKYLNQFSAWKADVINFHTGIRPTEYFEAKIKKNGLVDEKTFEESNKKLLNTTKHNIAKHLNSAQFNIDIEAYQKEINLLLEECKQIKQDEESLKNRMLELHNRKYILVDQKHIVEHSLKELSKDYKYAVTELPDSVQCPTCGYVHSNSFNERFNIAQDEYRCQELLTEINSELDNINKILESSTQKVLELKQQHSTVFQLLEARQGEVKLGDIIKSVGRQEVNKVLENELRIINSKIFDIEDKIASQEKIMKEYDDPDRTREIKSKYLILMKRFLRQLHVFNLPEKSYKRMDCSINETGSDYPRALLAFYFALLHIINHFSTSTFCPIVLDSAKQQDQDDINWRGMLTFMKEEQPENSQFIMGLVDDLGIDFKGKVIVLTDKYSLLQENEFDDVYKTVMPLWEQSRR